MKRLLALCSSPITARTLSPVATKRPHTHVPHTEEPWLGEAAPFESPCVLFVLQEERVVNHMAAKIIENVCTTFSAQAQGFTTGEIGPVLWHLFRHSTVDALRITAISVSVKSREEGARDLSTVFEEVPLNEGRFNGKDRDVRGRDISGAVPQQSSEMGLGE